MRLISKTLPNKDTASLGVETLPWYLSFFQARPLSPPPPAAPQPAKLPSAIPDRGLPWALRGWKSAGRAARNNETGESPPDWPLLLPAALPVRCPEHRNAPNPGRKKGEQVPPGRTRLGQGPSLQCGAVTSEGGRGSQGEGSCAEEGPCPGRRRGSPSQPAARSSLGQGQV